MRNLALATLVALALPLAGCVGPSEEVQGAATDPPPADEASPVSRPADAPPAPSSPTPRPSSPPAANGTSPPEPATPETLPLRFEGSLPTFVETCMWAAVMGQCHAVAPQGEFNNWFDLDAAGNVTKFTLTLTWTASSPANDVLELWFHSFPEDFSDWIPHAYVKGTSPLTIDLVEPVALDPSYQHQIGVSVPSTGAFVGVAGALAAAGTEQTFLLEGSMTIVRPSAAAP